MQHFGSVSVVVFVDTPRQARGVPQLFATLQPPDACHDFCAAHEKPWGEKCAWPERECSSCDQCAGAERFGQLSQPNASTTMAPVGLRPSHACLPYCAAHEKPWGEKCAWDERECSACAECAGGDLVYTEQPSQPESTATAPTESLPPSDACLAFCAQHEKSWTEKCAWPDHECSACDDCVATVHAPVGYSNEQEQTALSNLIKTHDAAAVIVDAGTRKSVGGVECGTYLIVSMQRSGTTTLCADILQIGGTWPHTLMDCAFEQLNFGAEQKGGAFLEQHNRSHDWGKTHPQETIRTARAEGQQTCAWGFKLFDTHGFDVSQVVDEVDLCVIYRRRNATAQYLSLKTALSTGCWATTPEQQARDPRCQSSDKVTRLGDDWPVFKAKADGWYNASREACRAAGKPTREFYMEDYLDPKLKPEWQEHRKAF